jgi:hypothetical protein
MKDPKIVRWLTLLAALVQLYGGIDNMARIERTTLDILVGTLLITFGIGLFVVAWTGRPLTAMNSTIGKLLVYAFCDAPGAFVVGLCLVRTIKHFDSLYLTFMALFGASLISSLFWTRRQVRRLAPNETAKKHATQFLWSCIFFSMLSLMLGMAVSGYVWFGTNFIRRFGVVFYTVMVAVGIYLVCRDAERLADAVGPTQSTSV